MNRAELISSGYMGLCEAVLAPKWSSDPAYARMVVRHRIWRDRNVMHRGHVGTKAITFGEVADVAGADEKPLEDMIAVEEVERLHAAIRCLTPLQRHVIRWRMAGWPVADMQSELGVTKDAVLKILRRAMAALRVWLGGGESAAPFLPVD